MNSKLNNTMVVSVFLGLLTLLLIALKLTGYVTWSWWWVLSPVWITATAVIVSIIVCSYLVYKVTRK